MAGPSSADDTPLASEIQPNLRLNLRLMADAEPPVRATHGEQELTDAARTYGFIFQARAAMDVLYSTGTDTDSEATLTEWVEASELVADLSGVRNHSTHRSDLACRLKLAVRRDSEQESF